MKTNTCRTRSHQKEGGGGGGGGWLIGELTITYTHHTIYFVLNKTD